MAFVFLENNRGIVNSLTSPNWNYNDTYFMAFGNRDTYYDYVKDTMNLLSALGTKYKVNVLLHAISANNYYAHIGEFSWAAITDGRGLVLHTMVFELAEGSGVEILDDQTNVQPLSTMSL